MSEIALFDLDDTIISGQSATLLVKYLFKKGKLNFGALIATIIWMFFYKMGIVKDVFPAMERSYKIAKGWKVTEAQKMMKDFFDSELKDKLYSEILGIIKEHKSKKRKIAVVSNSAQILVDEVGRFLNVDYAFGTQLEIKNNIYTGKINGEPLYGQKKVDLIKTLSLKEGWDLKNSFAYSDHYSDELFLRTVGNPVAVNPDKDLKICAEKNNWHIEYFKL